MRFCRRAHAGSRTTSCYVNRTPAIVSHREPAPRTRSAIYARTAFKSSQAGSRRSGMSTGGQTFVTMDATDEVALRALPAGLAPRKLTVSTCKTVQRSPISRASCTNGRREAEKRRLSRDRHAPGPCRGRQGVCRFLREVRSAPEVMRRTVRSGCDRYRDWPGAMASS
jgi:hypothetical protein